MKKLFSAIALCFVCVLALVGCTAPKDFMPKESDFEVFVSLEQTEITAGETLSFTIHFKNNCGYTLKNATHGGVFLRYTLWDDERDISYGYTGEAITEPLTKKEQVRKEEIETAGLAEGTHYIKAYCNFTYKDVEYTIYSSVYEITIL